MNQYSTVGKRILRPVIHTIMISWTGYSVSWVFLKVCYDLCTPLKKIDSWLTVLLLTIVKLIYGQSLKQLVSEITYKYIVIIYHDFVIIYWRKKERKILFWIIISKLTFIIMPKTFDNPMNPSFFSLWPLKHDQHFLSWKYFKLCGLGQHLDLMMVVGSKTFATYIWIIHIIFRELFTHFMFHQNCLL